MSKLGQFQEWPEDLNVPYGPYRAVIERMVDGDTVHAVVSLGLDEHGYRMIRIKGAFAPELFSGPPEERERGKAARDFLGALLPVGTKCRLTTERDVFGRYVASIELEDGTDVATTLIEAGHADAYLSSSGMARGFSWPALRSTVRYRLRPERAHHRIRPSHDTGLLDPARRSRKG